MNTFFLKTKKIIAITIITSILAPQISLAQGVPVSDVQNTTLNYMDVIKEYGLDGLAYMLTNTLSAKISNKILNKANGGASGDSSQTSFIQNFSDYFVNLRAEQIDRFVNDIGASKNPYASQITKNIIQSTQRNVSQPGRSALDSFNLDTVIGPNHAEFSTDASVGGWDGMLALLNPANSSLGSVMIAQQELDERLIQKTAEEQLRLTSTGTTPQGTCDMDFSEYKQQIQDIRTQRGLNQTDKQSQSALETRINAQLSDLPSNNAPSDRNTPRPVGGTTIGSGHNPNNPVVRDAATRDPQVTQLEQLEANIKQGKKDVGMGIVGTTIDMGENYGRCLQEMITNPAAFVTSGIETALNSAADALTAGDELAEMVATILLQLINTTISSGITALKANFQANRAAVGGPEELVGANGQAIPWTQVPNTIIDLSEEFQPTLEATEREVGNIRKFLEEIASTDENKKTFAVLISELDQCIPGPDYGYSERFSAYISKQTKRLEKRKDKGKEKKTVPKNNALDNIEASIESAQLYMNMTMSSSNQNIPAAGAMLANIETITNIREQYQDAKSELSKKQITLNQLYSIEGKVSASMLSLNTIFPDMPRNIPFTTMSWDRLDTTGKTTTTNWIKKTVLQIPTNNQGIVSSDIPLTTGDWTALSTAKRASLIQWAQEFTGVTKEPTTTDQDFVLATAHLMAGLPTGTTTETVKRDFVIANAWKIWANPENYMTESASTAWNRPSTTYQETMPQGINVGATTTNQALETIPAKIFLNLKNEIRSEYYALRNNVSIPYTAERAENALRQMTIIKDQTQKFLSDCNTLRELANNNRPAQLNDPQAHENFRKVLEQNINRFQSLEMKNAIETPALGGILSKSPIATADDFRLSGIPNCKDKNNSIVCYDGSELIPADYGMDDDNDRPLSSAQEERFTSYQSQPVRNIWELLDKKVGNQDTAFCGLNEFLRLYPNEGGYIPQRILDGAKEITCSTDWTRISSVDVRAIIYSTNTASNYSFISR